VKGGRPWRSSKPRRHSSLPRQCCFHPAAEAEEAGRAPRPRTTGTRWTGTKATGV